MADWRNYCNEELPKFYNSQNAIRLISSETTGLTGDVTRMREMRV
jgi:hypothetical protein